MKNALLKNSVLWILLTLLLTTVFVSLKSEKIHLTGKKLSVLSQSECVDWRGEKGWRFTTRIGTNEKSFNVYPEVFNTLVYNGVVEVNLAEIDDQFPGHDTKISFEHLGKTKEEVHIFFTYDAANSHSHLLFVEFEKNQGIRLDNQSNTKTTILYEDQVLIRKVGVIHLGWVYYDTQDFSLVENTLTARDYVFNLDMKPPALSELITDKFFLRFDDKPFISPPLVESFTPCPRSGYSSIISVDLDQTLNNLDYCFLGNGLRNSNQRDYKYDHIEYEYKGMTKNGIHIVQTINFSPHPPTSPHLFFVYEKDYELALDWDRKTITRSKSRNLLKNMGFLWIYPAGETILEGNTFSYTDMWWENMPFTIMSDITYFPTVLNLSLH